MTNISKIRTVDSRGVECIWGDIEKHPHCAHGPTLLFSQYIDGHLEEFYACSACRSRQLCSFYLKKDDIPLKLGKNIKGKELKPFPKDQHHKLYIKFHQLMNEKPDDRHYCHSCEVLFTRSQKHKHEDHEVTVALTDCQMTHPTEILKPLEDAQKEAQYLFSNKCTKEIVEMIMKLEAKQVLCIGTPRIHEWIIDNYDNKVSSLLLDFDDRFHNFFGPLSFGQYNLFNNHFFTKEAKEIFKIFMTQNNGKDIILLCDPPFGGRVEAISQTLKTICDLHKKWNQIQHEDEGLKIMFFFPYFMESIMKMKSNPPNVTGGLKELQMTDYEVDYDNHPMFRGDKNKKSPVRMFTNISLRLLELPAIDGYKYCKTCEKWISSENKHCKKCNKCTSKNGKKFTHCNICKRCVKATWKHCMKCKRCTSETHTCGSAPKMNGRCYKCSRTGHTEKDCTYDFEQKKNPVIVSARKRKFNDQKNGKKISKKSKSLLS